ncbi:isochorismatase family protein [Achromobacter arsenitoxydans]|uniref:Uncharacterized protein n=1 Tax=Achromobacter arsenitoxydans SY8 TaxID=477184 RepID=H0F463_9BURK|nr:isochorismatase family protein [Achromobacter arsenitoxydans]EHK66958.1 hypothetical protein KYC_07775 [Achromobacter arsenitoxydans SY8]
MTSALIVIDVQRALFETSPPPFEATEVLARINALADRARAAGALIRAHHNATLPAISSFGVKIAAVPAADLFAGGAPR